MATRLDDREVPLQPPVAIQVTVLFDKIIVQRLIKNATWWPGCWLNRNHVIGVFVKMKLLPSRPRCRQNKEAVFRVQRPESGPGRFVAYAANKNNDYLPIEKL